MPAAPKTSLAQTGCSGISVTMPAMFPPGQAFLSRHHGRAQVRVSGREMLPTRNASWPAGLGSRSVRCFPTGKHSRQRSSRPTVRRIRRWPGNWQGPYVGLDPHKKAGAFFVQEGSDSVPAPPPLSVFAIFLQSRKTHQNTTKKRAWTFWHHGGRGIAQTGRFRGSYPGITSFSSRP